MSYLISLLCFEIHSVDRTPPLLLGDDLLLRYLGTVSYESHSKALSPYPDVSFKNPIFVETQTIYEKLSLMYSVDTNVSLLKRKLSAFI